MAGRGRRGDKGSAAELSVPILFECDVELGKEETESSQFEHIASTEVSLSSLSDVGDMHQLTASRVDTTNDGI